MTRTFAFGNADARYLEIHRLVRKAQLAGIHAIRAGVTAREVDRAARAIIADAGYGQYFGHALGHGVGLAVHEEPRLSSRNQKATEIRHGRHRRTRHLYSRMGRNQAGEYGCGP